jgi:hypothetical protein
MPKHIYGHSKKLSVADRNKSGYFLPNRLYGMDINMKFPDIFLKIEIVVLNRNFDLGIRDSSGHTARLTDALEKLYSALDPKDLARAKARGCDLVEIKKVEPTFSDGLKLFQSAKIEVGTCKSLETDARSAIQLSKLLGEAPVTISIYDVVATVGVFDDPISVALRLRKGIEEKVAKGEPSLAIDVPARDETTEPAVASNIIRISFNSKTPS